MGLFEKAGRRFEKFKKATEEAAEEEAEYGCTACETVLYTAQEECPECGAAAVVVLETGEPVTEEDVEDGPSDSADPGGEASETASDPDGGTSGSDSDPDGGTSAEAEESTGDGTDSPGGDSTDDGDA
ncbi:hypothetical protein BRD00_15370 [Halobacteriales archaeon QS_8_69_26]|nr:MAG: hypothetical protein BRD00_15370 [Halobacteriales archaeon QS_8_69_26]